MSKTPTPLSNIADIIDYIRRNIRVDRESLCRTFNLTDSDYQKLGRFLSKDNQVETVGGRAGGGFRWTDKASRFSTDENIERTIARLLASEDERQAALKIAESFSALELNKLLSDRLRNALRSYKRHTFGKDTQPTKGEMAAGLIIQHGTELFRNKEIRAAVAEKLKISNIERWVPGLRGAANFVQNIGFPQSFCGEANEDRPPLYKLLEQKRKYPDLEDFQRRAKNHLLTAIQKKSTRIILQLPTGSGKTRIAVETIRDFLLSFFNEANTYIYTVIWTAHQDELCEQAAETIEKAWINASEACPVNLIRFFGQQTEESLIRATDQGHVNCPTIVVTTPIKALKIVQSQNDRVRAIGASTRLIMIDEAHRAAAPSYRTLLSALPSTVSVIGLTATPYGKVYLGESSTDELLSIFNNNIIKPESLFEDFNDQEGLSPKVFLREKRILAKPVVYEVPTGKRIGGTFFDQALSEEEIEKNSEELDNLIRQDIAGSLDRTQSIFRSLLPIFNTEGNSILYFAPTVQDALTITFLLRVEGISAECVHAGTPTGLREKYISQFRNQGLRVLCNVEILTTGFDAPCVTHVVVARPTVSRVLYEQIVGRGLRGPKFGGTEICTIIDCIDIKPQNRLKFGYEYFREDWGIESTETISTN